MTNRFYIDRFGNSVPEEEACDHRGMLKDGYGIRASMFMDSATAINDAAAWASSPVGAAAMAREAMIAGLSCRPARTASDLFADAKAAADAYAKAAPIRDAQAATAAVMAREARAEMIARLNGRETRA